MLSELLEWVEEMPAAVKPFFWSSVPVLGGVLLGIMLPGWLTGLIVSCYSIAFGYLFFKNYDASYEEKEFIDPASAPWGCSWYLTPPRKPATKAIQPPKTSDVVAKPQKSKATPKKAKPELFRKDEREIDKIIEGMLEEDEQK